MSKIIVISESRSLDVKSIMLLKQVTNTGISELKKRIQSGSPFLEVTLFMNIHEEVAKTLRATMNLFEQNKYVLNIFELEPDEDFTSCPKHECLISSEILENILKRWESS